ncbi:Thrombospondin type-1 domain-containing protein 7A [Liparis tanakae]|uniref:Thrombospondin type-1 domain-containing protein 7A n=1 Tax=Liparis tanakae TaxID=230148 RepID=A0A4Z2ELT2_9TELE|nr:Thrombospondin type-1 domain-containing protein 7A [Liparis tanakae]
MCVRANLLTRHILRSPSSIQICYIEEACIIPCPSDCKLSEWSNWSRCSKSCGSGVKVRSKWLREKPYNGGRPCPKLDHINQVGPGAPSSILLPSHSKSGRLCFDQRVFICVRVIRISQKVINRIA